MAVPAPTNFAIINPSFELGDTTGWTVRADTPGLPGVGTAVTDNPYAGSWSGLWLGTAPGGSSDSQSSRANWINNARGTVAVGQSVTVTAALGMNDRSNSANQGEARIYWLDAADNIVGYTSSTKVQGNSSAWRVVSATGTAPAGATHVAAGVWVKANAAGGMRVDSLSWNYTYTATANLTQPTSVTGYNTQDNIPLRVEISSSNLTPTQVIYRRQVWNGTDWEAATELAVVNEAPWAANAGNFAVGRYRVYAEVYMSDGSFITTNMSTFDVAEPTPPDTREYKASNAYTYLVGENILNLGAGLPPTAVVTGVEVELDCALTVISRVKDKLVTDVEQFTNSTPFDVINGGVFETTLMSKSNGQYTVLGSPNSLNMTIEESDFTLTDQKKSGEFKLVFFSSAESTYTMGGETDIFNLGSVPASEFLTYAVGVRFYPTVNAKPDYADYGDAVVRVKIGSFKVRVFFDAGSVEYYFASPDKQNILKGTLVAYNVSDGDFRNGDASGILQLSPVLEVIEGDQLYIGDDWTIHSGYPVTDRNQIGTVASREEDDGIGMSYNSLPGQEQVYQNRSRYVFITANFYGDIALESMYGANGVGRAFAYNGEDFYNIYTTPDPIKDSPRHVAFHHSHLALGYDDGRVDISVVGEPFNFSGLDGASSWAIGDSVTGLLPLSGTVLGVFCKKSIAGISGTTVDNFATQTLSPSLGAIEYTCTNMGYPVYANAYGIYTLSQTQEYGDYLGTPLSQQVSPWLRPRLIRKFVSDKEVVVAWPVRSKNQYKLAFADGYVLSMTMNYGQQSSPTFSTQKYFITDDFANYDGLSLYEYPSIYPIAISSELDDSGEERIHVANYYKEPPVPVTPPSISGDLPDATEGDVYTYQLTITGGVAPVKVTSYSGPAGLVVSEDGLVTWPVPMMGDHEVQVQVTDLIGQTGGWQDQLNVNEVPGDPFWINVISVMNYEGTGSTFVDGKPLTWESQGGITQSGGGVTLSSNGQSLWSSLQGAVVTLNGDYTVEAFISVSSYNPSWGCIMNLSPGSKGLYINGSGEILFYDSGVVSSHFTVPLNQKVHVCLERKDGIIRTYLNGVGSVGTPSELTTIVNEIGIGADQRLNAFFRGTIYATRLTAGVARYNGQDFAVPVDPFPERP